MTNRTRKPLLPTCKLLLAAILLTSSIAASELPTAIHVDQVGYPPQSRKLAIVDAPDATSRFTVHRLPGGEAILHGNLGPPVEAPHAGRVVRHADFSAVTTPGRYVLRVSGVEPSFAFEIGNEPWSALLRLTLRSFYGQRCGAAVDLGPDDPSYAHPACHLTEAYHTSSGREGSRGSTGGWHDAGDYGRYVVNSGISTGTLLWAWEMFPERFRDLGLGIPESDDETPDLLDEVRWNLDWMLSMQDEDGGVWHKQTSEVFPPMVLPQDDDSISFVIGTGSEPYKSSCATASLAAAMAIAARVYEPYDPSFAKAAREAATNAWKWTAEHPDVAFENPPGVATGEYGDRKCQDERLWAAAEIWRTTGDPSIGQWFLDHAEDATLSIVPNEPPDWHEVAALAAWSYALSGKGEAPVVEEIVRRSVLAADTIVERAGAHGYRIPLDEDDFEWGSNGVAANYGLQLLVTNQLHADPAYAAAARDIVHYLLGRNPLSISWVTGAGARPVMHPHHRPSAGDGNELPWPGLLAGGPNRKRQDPAMAVFPPETPPALMYLDQEESYATNEIAINWNAPLVFVLAGVME